MVNLELPKAIQ